MDRELEINMNQEALRSFIQRANKEGYGSGKENWKKEEDGSTTIVCKFGDFRAHDNFFGGEHYGGRKVIFYKGEPVWIMVYYGAVVAGQDINRIYATIQKALSNAPAEMPVRGPRELEYRKLTYENGWRGNIENFSGHEAIVNEKGRTVCTVSYMGGLVDQRKE